MPDVISWGKLLCDTASDRPSALQSTFLLGPQATILSQGEAEPLLPDCPNIETCVLLHSCGCILP